MWLNSCESLMVIDSEHLVVIQNIWQTPLIQNDAIIIFGWNEKTHTFLVIICLREFYRCDLHTNVQKPDFSCLLINANFSTTKILFHFCFKKINLRHIKPKCVWFLISSFISEYHIIITTMRHVESKILDPMSVKSENLVCKFWWI